MNELDCWGNPVHVNVYGQYIEKQTFPSCIIIIGATQIVLNADKQQIFPFITILSLLMVQKCCNNWSYASFYWKIMFYPVVLFIYLGFYVTFNTVQVISRRVVGRAEETSTCSSSGFCKLPTNGKQLPAFPLEAVPGTEP